MCNLYLEGTRAVVDLAKCPYEFASPEFLNLHLKDLSTQETPIKTIRYEEEIVVELDEEKTKLLTQYAGFIRQLETILLKEEIYGLKQDPAYHGRRKMLRRLLKIFKKQLKTKKIPIKSKIIPWNYQKQLKIYLPWDLRKLLRNKSHD